MNPDIIVLLAPFYDGKTTELNQLKELWKTLPINAAKQNNIYTVDKLYAGIPSQRVEFFINDFRKILEDVRNK
jgi:iron complex transport system substrate-binding protein